VVKQVRRSGRWSGRRRCQARSPAVQSQLARTPVVRKYASEVGGGVGAILRVVGRYRCERWQAGAGSGVLNQVQDSGVDGKTRLHRTLAHLPAPLRLNINHQPQGATAEVNALFATTCTTQTLLPAVAGRYLHRPTPIGIPSQNSFLPTRSEWTLSPESQPRPPLPLMLPPFQGLIPPCRREMRSKQCSNPRLPRRRRESGTRWYHCFAVGADSSAAPVPSIHRPRRPARVDATRRVAG
jgi:hypothetical protein